MSTGKTTELEITEGGSGGNPFKGLRFLVVDDNKDDLHTLVPALHSLGSQVTTCPDQTEATRLFCEKTHKFDAVLAKVDWQIGFEFFEYVWLKMNIPIIAISSVEDRKLIIEAINHGAHFVLLRPVQIDKLQRVWPFVLANIRRALVRNQESASGEAKDQSSRNEEGARGCKRSESGSEEVNQPHSHRNLMKKSSLVWTDKFKRRFPEILQRFGEKNVTPKRVVELRNEPELTNENVSSHLPVSYIINTYIRSVLMLRQTMMDGGEGGGILGATQEKGESSRGNWNAQNNGTEDPVENGAPNVDKSSLEDSIAKTPSPRNSDSRADTNHPETTDGGRGGSFDL